MNGKNNDKQSFKNDVNNKQFNQILGELLRLGSSQSEISDILKISETHFSRVKSGERHPEPNSESFGNCIALRSAARIHLQQSAQLYRAGNILSGIAFVQTRHGLIYESGIIGLVSLFAAGIRLAEAA